MFCIILADTHKHELNPTNPLGMQGKIAEAYAELMHQMWGANNSYVMPRQFKVYIFLLGIISIYIYHLPLKRGDTIWIYLMMFFVRKGWLKSLNPNILQICFCLLHVYNIKMLISYVCVKCLTWHWVYESPNGQNVECVWLFIHLGWRKQVLDWILLFKCWFCQRCVLFSSPLAIDCWFNLYT